MLSLHVYVYVSTCIVCIVCICMYPHVLRVLKVLYVCVCIVCMCMYFMKYFYIYIHIHTHTHIQTIQTKNRYVANVCMRMYFWFNTYTIHTACFIYIHIQTCRFPDARPAPPSGGATWCSESTNPLVAIHTLCAAYNSRTSRNRRLPFSCCWSYRLTHKQLLCGSGSVRSKPGWFENVTLAAELLLAPLPLPLQVIEARWQ